MKLADRIVADPETCSGHPRIEGTRVRVSNVLGWLASGMSAAQIVADYPYLTEADIHRPLSSPHAQWIRRQSRPNEIPHRREFAASLGAVVCVTRP